MSVEIKKSIVLIVISVILICLTVIDRIENGIADSALVWASVFGVLIIAISTSNIVSIRTRSMVRIK